MDSQRKVVYYTSEKNPYNYIYKKTTNIYKDWQLKKKEKKKQPN